MDPFALVGSGSVNQVCQPQKTLVLAKRDGGREILIVPGQSPRPGMASEVESWNVDIGIKMNIDPALVTHPKFEALVLSLGPEAGTILMRIWGHCQMNHRGSRWGKVNSDYVEMVAKWGGPAGECWKALTASVKGMTPWLSVSRAGHVSVHDWEKHNGSLVSAWRNGSKGGRPKRNHHKPTGNRSVTGRYPTGNRSVTGRYPTGNRSVSHGIPEGLQGVSEPSPSSPPSLSPPVPPLSVPPLPSPSRGSTPPPLSSEFAAQRDPQIPSEAEVLSYASMIGLVAWKAHDWWLQMESVGWRLRGSQISAWQPALARVRTQWEADGRPMSHPSFQGAKGSRGASVSELRTMERVLTEKIAASPANSSSTACVAEPTPEEREELKKNRAVLREVKEKIAGCAQQEVSK